MLLCAIFQFFYNINSAVYKMWLAKFICIKHDLIDIVQYLDVDNTQNLTSRDVRFRCLLLVLALKGLKR